MYIKKMVEMGKGSNIRNEVHPHAFKMERDGHWEILTPHTRLSKLLLDEGEQLHFLYDTKGNKWEHTLTVEAIQ